MSRSLLRDMLGAMGIRTNGGCGEACGSACDGGALRGYGEAVSRLFYGSLAMSTVSNTKLGDGGMKTRKEGGCAVASFPAFRPSRMSSDNAFPLNQKPHAD